MAVVSEVRRGAPTTRSVSGLMTMREFSALGLSKLDELVRRNGGRVREHPTSAARTEIVLEWGRGERANVGDAGIGELTESGPTGGTSTLIVNERASDSRRPDDWHSLSGVEITSDGEVSRVETQYLPGTPVELLPQYTRLLLQVATSGREGRLNP